MANNMISPDKMKKAIIPELNPIMFSKENYNNDNSILMHKDKMRKYAVGYCCANELSVRPREDQFAIMYDVYGEEDNYPYIENGKYWCHLGWIGFIDIFIPDYFIENKGE